MNSYEMTRFYKSINDHLMGQSMVSNPLAFQSNAQYDTEEACHYAAQLAVERALENFGELEDAVMVFSEVPPFRDEINAFAKQFDKENRNRQAIRNLLNRSRRQT